MNKHFVAKLRKLLSMDGWTYVVMPNAAKFFKTKGLVKIRGTIDGHPFRSSFMAMGDGTHKLPVKEKTRKLIGNDVGDSVNILVKERID